MGRTGSHFSIGQGFRSIHPSLARKVGRVREAHQRTLPTLCSPTQSRITVFAGTVGAGKSTQIRLLASKLKRKGASVRTTFLKTGHLAAYLLEVVLARMITRGGNYESPIRALIEQKPRLFAKVFKLWLALDIIGVSLKFLFKIYIPFKVGCVVLVEDYIPATIVDYMYLTKAIGLSSGASSIAVNFVLRLQHLGRPGRVVFLDASTDALKRRWRLRNQACETPDYLHMQRTTLLFLSKMSSFGRLLYVDTTHQPIEKVHRLIMNYVTRVCTMRGLTDMQCSCKLD